MRRNRKVTRRHSVMIDHAIQFGAVIVMAFVMVIVSLLANASCDQRQKAIGGKKRVLEALDKDLKRETARWEEMNSADNLRRELVRHGISMRYPEDDQIVRMSSSGVPLPGQLSVAKHGRNRGTATTAQYTQKKRR